MAPTTRSSHGRLSSGSKGSSPQVQAGPSRGASLQGTSQRAASAAAKSNAGLVGSDDDDDDDDDDDEDDDDDDDDDDDEESEDDSEEEDDDNDSDDNDEEEPDLVVDRRVELLKIFASTEPNGLVMPEIAARHGDSVSQTYRQLMSVVTTEALRNQEFYDNILKVLKVPSDGWSKLVYVQLRNRFDLAMYQRNPNMVRDTANRLGGLINAIGVTTGQDYWRMMQPLTKLNYFGLLLGILQQVVASDAVASRPGSGSGGSSPFTGDPAMNHNLYRIMVSDSHCSTAVNMLKGLFTRMEGQLDVRHVTNLRAMLDQVQGRNKVRRTPSPGRSLSPPEQFLIDLQELCDALPAPASRRSRGHR